MSQQGDALDCFTQTHLICQDAIDALTHTHTRTGLETETERAHTHLCAFTSTDLFVKVSEPVHALELVGFELAVEDGGLRDVLSSLDGGIRQAVALPEPGAGATPTRHV